MILDQIKENPLFAGTLPNEKSIGMLGNKPLEGQIYFIQKDDTYKVWKNGELQPIESAAFEGLKMSLYDINKMAINQMKPIQQKDMKTLVYNPIEDFCKNNASNSYFMLLCKELSYYTVFHRQKNSTYISLAEGVVDCLADLGDCYELEYNKQNNSVEIWIKTYANSEPVVLYLFPYDSGVCTFGG